MNCGNLILEDLPEIYIHKWQESMELLSEISGDHAVLLRVKNDRLFPVCSSALKQNLVFPEDSINIIPGSVFEKVLEVAEPVSGDHFFYNKNMHNDSISCSGVRISLPDRDTFGVIALFRTGEKIFNPDSVKILTRFARIIEADLGIYIHDSLINDNLEKREFHFEERFRQLAENIREVFWIGSADWNQIIYISPAYEEIWGRSCSSLYEIPRSWFDSVHRDDRDALLASVNNRISGHSRDFSFPEYRIIRPDGTIRWIYARAFPILNNAGEVYRVAGIAEDITERKNSEAELRLKEMATDSAISGIAISDMNGSLIYINRSFLEIWGYSSKTEVLGMNVTAFWEDPRMVHDISVKMIKEGVQKTVMRGKRKDGSIFSAQLMATILRSENGTPLYMMASFLDISEQIKEHEILIKSEAKLREAQELAHLGYWDYEIKQDRLTWSDEMYRIFGLEPHITPPTYDAFIDNIHPEERDFIQQVYTGFIYSKIPYDIIHRFLLKDGSVKYVNERCRIECDEYGKAVRSFGTVLDITERMLSEIRLKEMLTEKEILLREIYHRTRNNMQVICGLIELKASYIQNSVLFDQCIEIQNRILTMALVHEKLCSSGNLSKINFREYVHELVHLLKERYYVTDKIDVSINIDIDDILMDYAVPCGLIICELVSNSIKHAFPESRSGSISVSGSRNDGELELSVTDNGRGFPAGYDAYSMDSFGLMIMRNIVLNQLRGDLKYSSCEGVSWIIRFSDNQYFERI